MIWLWIPLGVVAAVPASVALALLGLYFYLRKKYVPFLVRIFQERPLFIIPRGQPIEDAEEVSFLTSDGLTLRGCYLRTKFPRRKGVIFFGLEFGSNRWSCVPYCEFLRADGFDIFTFEPRCQGDSEVQPGYEPLQWVTNYEIEDFRAALGYLKRRPDADPRGIGLFGISKGGSAGLLVAATEEYVRCFVTDGIFATHTTMLPYMRKWVQIYSTRMWLIQALPDWYYGVMAKAGLRRIRRESGCRFPHLEHVMHRLAPRPLLMIHGGNDTYIKPEMAQDLFDHARQPKEFWLVPDAKHNQAFHLAAEEYRARVLQFFRTHLAEEPPANGFLTPSAKPQAAEVVFSNP